MPGFTGAENRGKRNISAIMVNSLSAILARGPGLLSLPPRPPRAAATPPPGAGAAGDFIQFSKSSYRSAHFLPFSFLSLYFTFYPFFRKSYTLKGAHI